MITQDMIKLVAIVDDDDSIRSTVQGLLKAAGLQHEFLRRRRNF